MNHHNHTLQQHYVLLVKLEEVENFIAETPNKY